MKQIGPLGTTSSMMKSGNHGRQGYMSLKTNLRLDLTPSQMELKLKVLG